MGSSSNNTSGDENSAAANETLFLNFPAIFYRMRQPPDNTRVGFAIISAVNPRPRRISRADTSGVDKPRFCNSW